MSDRNSISDAERLARAQIELVVAEKELQLAEALREKQLSIREAELERNRALQEVGGELEKVTDAPGPVPETLLMRVQEARALVQSLKREVEPEAESRSMSPLTKKPHSPNSKPEPVRVNNSRLLLPGLLCLTLAVLNLPLVLYGLLYDRFPHPLTSVVYFGCFLFLALGATWICKRVFSQERGQSAELIFGLQVMVCALPGLFIGSYLASPYLKTTLLQPIKLSSPATIEQTLLSGYYQFDSAELRGDMQASRARTHTRKSGDSTTWVTTTYHVAPLATSNWQEKEPLRFWVVREGKENSFAGKSETLSPFHAIATRSTTTLEEAVEKSAERNGLAITENPIFLIELPSTDRAWYGRYLAISWGLVNLVVLGLIAFFVLRS